MSSESYLQDVVQQFEKYKTMAERAIAQVSDQDFLATFDDYSNSLAIIVKHMAGNMQSRWTDFLTTDGEKSDRYRDTEFVLDTSDSREELLQRWNAGWNCLFDALAQLDPNDLTKTVHIRGEPHAVIQAINRQLTHYSYHVGQIVMLARHFAGHDWQWLSIPPGKSAAYDVAKDGSIFDAHQ